MKKAITIIFAAAIILVVFFATIRPAYCTDGIAAAPVESASKYDISALEAWCGEPRGTCRMIGGWYYDYNTIETEDGHLWELNTESINEWELLLIWFDDMGTPDNVEDDQIVKVWSEVYD